MKNLLIAMFLILVASPCFSDMILYIGEQKGETISGIAAQVDFDPAYLYFDTRTTLEGMNENGISPTKVGFYSELGCNLGKSAAVAMSHTCKHAIDTAPEYQPSVNKMFVRFNW